MFVFRTELLELEELIKEEERATATSTSKPGTNTNKKSKQNNEDNGKFLDMYSSIYTMRQDLERIRKPLGTRDNPVRTCKDLFYGHPHFKDGKNQNLITNINQKFNNKFFQPFKFFRLVLDRP